MSANTNGWSEYAKLVLSKLEQNEEEHKAMFDKLDTLRDNQSAIRERQGTLNAKVVGIMAGVCTIASAAVSFVYNHLWK